MSLRDLDEPATLQALLGPTNTGKTHRAVRRMLGRRSGMIGLPLRLLAREVYDKVVAEVGEAKVALVTGEEKRIPREARYWVCTVESMPVDRPVEFLAVDEIQLCAHRERGHVFTDRLLNARGRRETWFMGADTMAPLVRELLPTAEIHSRPRFSRLRWSGCDELSDLPPRSAVVAYSVEQVYAVAERLRRRRGGAAVVLGALSPRARNAQVALYQNGDVNYLVATDAIGMGLNMDIDHVAFAAVRKFDGQQVRELGPAELAQVAGRAGRYRTDGSFGTLAEVGPLAPDLIAAIENHSFEPERRIYWRNTDLDFGSGDSLVESLRMQPPRRFMAMTERAEDSGALLRLLQDPEVRRRARGEAAVRLLWSVCRVPDYRKLLVDEHTEMLTSLYLQLSGPKGRVDTDWMAERLARQDRNDGDADTLTTRIAFIRSWTYITHQAGWIGDAAAWQGRAREIEDRLSDALHAQLTRRFVDHRPAVGALRRARVRPADPDAAETAEPRADSPFAALRGLDLPSPGLPRKSAAGEASRKAAEAERLALLLAADDSALVLAETAEICWQGQVLGRWSAGPERLRPEVGLLDPALSSEAARRAAHARLEAWTRGRVDALLSPLRREAAAGLSGAGRGLLYLLERGLGTLPNRALQAQLSQLEATDRPLLARLDVRLGADWVYVAGLLKPAEVAARAALLRAEGRMTGPVPPPGASSFAVAGAVAQDWLVAIGYPRVGPLAVRVDLLERVGARLRGLGRRGAFTVPDELMSWLGCSREALAGLLHALGHRPDGDQWRPPRSGPRAPARRRKVGSKSGDSAHGRRGG